MEIEEITESTSETEIISILVAEVIELKKKIASLTKKKSKSAGKSVEMWKIYVDEYVKRYSVKPRDSAKNRKHLCNVIDQIGDKESLELVRFYVRWNHPFFVARTHTLNILEMRCQEIYTQMVSGITVTDRSAQKMSKDQSNREAILSHYQSKKGRKNERQ